MDEAARYRELARQALSLASSVSTTETIEALMQMACEYDQKADELEKSPVPLIADK